MSDDWRFGALERVTLAFVLFVMWAFTVLSFAESLRQAGEMTAELSVALGRLNRLMLALFAVVAFGRPVLSPVVRAVRRRLAEVAA